MAYPTPLWSFWSWCVENPIVWTDDFLWWMDLAASVWRRLSSSKLRLTTSGTLPTVDGNEVTLCEGGLRRSILYPGREYCVKVLLIYIGKETGCTWLHIIISYHILEKSTVWRYLSLEKKLAAQGCTLSYHILEKSTVWMYYWFSREKKLAHTVAHYIEKIYLH